MTSRHGNVHGPKYKIAMSTIMWNTFEDVMTIIKRVYESCNNIKINFIFVI